MSPHILLTWHSCEQRNSVPREDDTNWPKKNIVGKQELEIRVGNDHIAFEVRSPLTSCSQCIVDVPYRRRSLGLWSISRTARTPRACASSTILFKTSR